MVAALCLAACPDPLMEEAQPDNGLPLDPSDTAFWFGEIYNLIDDGGSPASRSYVCAVINAKWGASVQPEPDTGGEAADCAFLLSKVDEANQAAGGKSGGKTAFGASAYANGRIVDVNTVLRTLDALYAPEGRFLALAQGRREAAWSADGAVWTKTSLPGDRNWQCAAYGNGTFVAFAYRHAKLAWSVNGGGSWREADLPAARPWTNVVYGGNKFVAFAANTSRACYSVNGINWTDIILPASAEWRALAYGAGDGKEFFVALARSYGHALYSTDGLIWTETSMPSESDWYSLAYGEGAFVAIDYGSAKTARSTDGGKTWAFAGDLPSGMKQCGVAFGEVSSGNGLLVSGMFVALPYTAGSDKAAYSRDKGISWTGLTLTEGGAWTDIAFGKTVFAALDLRDGKVLYSSGKATEAALWTTAEGALTNLSNTTSHWQTIVFGR